MIRLPTSLLLIVAVLSGGTASAGGPDMWRSEWPVTDFTRYSVDLHEIMSGGPPRDGIPAVDDPRFAAVDDPAVDLAAQEPVIACQHGGEARAYPLRILMFHEIVNDVIGGLAVAVTYCPLCNASIVFDREVGGQVLDFGTTGKLRNSDLVMYDRQTESWWQQFTGEAIVGAMTGAELRMIPSQLMPFGLFARHYPDGMVLLPPNADRSYGSNPYAGYDTSAWPFLYRGDYDGALAPLDYVLAIGDQAWSLALLQRERRVEAGGLVIVWQPGMNSALDERWIPNGQDIGHVTVTDGDGSPVVHDLTFAFAFSAFNPDGTIHH
ncbi:MAG: DUF3179 domain-containing protein [Alphaproteobacteria bacterium]